ncbi:proline-rich basic protein 1 isoform X2 [Onychostruthus taczanowskii]|uniref:proline-rich basic protein 1 isoform X2 n=1 Tax=Onychostruthus taczanowskii TaxID=356909 RepID=UPI001B80D573|nr:proline-rich basic protein 1 isoform X2 [Onychostruthus taczanowskii]
MGHPQRGLQGPPPAPGQPRPWDHNRELYGVPWDMSCGLGRAGRDEEQGWAGGPRQIPEAGGGGGIPAMRLASAAPAGARRVHVIRGLLCAAAGSSRRDGEGARRSSQRPRQGSPSPEQGSPASAEAPGLLPATMPRGKRDPVLLSPAELPGPEGEGPRAAADGRRSAEEEEEEDGHLPGLPRDDLTKSMSSSSVSSYHSALCSDGTETFKDCLEFLDEEGSPGRAAPGRWAPAGSPGVPPPPGPLARPQRAQLSSAAKNSPAPGQGGRMGPLGGDREPVPAAAAGGEPAVPRQPGTMLAGAPSDSDEVDGEVQALTARAFRSLSGLPGARLDMCSSHTSSSLSNSLSEDGGRPRRWPAGAGEPRGAATALHGRVGWPFLAGVDGELLGKEHFECVDVELESGEARKGHGKKRTVPKRQILLKRKERKETGFGPRGDGPAPQPPARKEPPSKGRAVGEDFRLNYQQFMKAASLEAGPDRTRAASCLVKNVLAKKMQYEQRIKMEQKGLRGSSTSSGPSSAGTDLLGDGLEGKSSSLSRSDCSFSAEDLRGGGMPVATAVAESSATTTHPTKGVVLSEATRETVCNLRKTFNELNQRMKYQEVLEGRWLPAAAEKHTSERICYQRARALFEAQPGVGKVLDVAPRFARAPRPWPSLKERAIGPIHSQSLPFKAESRALPATPPRRPFASSRAQEARTLPQSQPEKPPAVPRRPASPGTIPAPRGSPPAAPPKPEEKGKGRVPQPRDVRKLVKSSYSLKFGTAGASRGTVAPASSGEPPPATPLVIHCTSVRREPPPEPAGEEVLAAPGREPAPACVEGPAKTPHSSPINITRVQATRRGAAPTEEPPASPPRRERSELRLPPRAPAAERVPHVETHLHVLVGRPAPAARESSPAQSSAVLRAEKTVLLPPSPAEGEEVRGRGSSRALPAAEGPESPGQRPRSGDSRDPRAGAPGGSSARPRPAEPAARSAAEPGGSEQRQQQPGGRRVSVGSGGSAGATGPAAPLRAGDSSEASPGRLPEQREAWERSPQWPAATEPHPPAAPAENSNYLAIPERAPKSTQMPKLSSVPNPGSASFGTPFVPSPASASFGAPSAPNPASASFGTSMVTNVTGSSFGFPSVSNLCSTSFGNPLVPNPSSASTGNPLVPNPSSMSFGNPLVPNPSSASIGNPLVPNPSSMSFGNPLVPNVSSASFGNPLVPNPSSMSFGNPLVPNVSSASFGNPLVPNPSSMSFGNPLVPNASSMSIGNPLVPNPSSASIGNPLVPNPSSMSFGNPLVPNVSSASFGNPLVPNPSSMSFGNPLVPNASSMSSGNTLVPSPFSMSFGNPLVPNASSASFGNPLVPNPSSASFGSPLIPNPSSASFESPLVPNPSSASFGNPLVPNPGSSSFGSPLVSNPAPTSLGHPSVSSVAGSFFGSPFVPNPASAPLGTGAYPLPGGEVPWGKPSPEPPLPRPPEGSAAVEPPAQPHLEDAPHFLRRTDGSSPSGRSRQSPPKPFPTAVPAQRRMLVDPSSGKFYYMEPPRQPQMKTLYDPETGQYLEVLVPPVASHTGLYQAPFNPLVMAPGVYGPPYASYGGFPGLPAPPPSAPSPPHPSLPAPDCGYLESLYYIPTGMRASPGPEQPPARASPAAPEGSLLRM